MKIFLQELLLSYRVLLGQDAKSRRIYRTLERPKIQSRGHFDLLLEELCGRKVPRRDDILQGIPGDQEVYSTLHDFLHFGERLSTLQAYGISQNPSRLKDLWNDRRNPLQFFTFWAVIIVGGLSITLSFVQVLLTASQLGTSVGLIC